jgi:hypothetical protein
MNPQNHRATENLGDGTAVTIRAIRPDDRAKVVAAFMNLDREWRRDNRERYNEGASARSAARRARQRNGTGDSAATRRAWRKLRREAKALGMAIDHRVPLKPCAAALKAGTSRAIGRCCRPS